MNKFKSHLLTFHYFVLQYLFTVMHPLLLYIVANTAENIHRDRVSAHVSISLVKGLQHSTTNVEQRNHPTELNTL